MLIRVVELIASVDTRGKAKWCVGRNNYSEPHPAKGLLRMHMQSSANEATHNMAPPITNTSIWLYNSLDTTKSNQVRGAINGGGLLLSVVVHPLPPLLRRCYIPVCFL